MKEILAARKALKEKVELQVAAGTFNPADWSKKPETKPEKKKASSKKKGDE